MKFFVGFTMVLNSKKKNLLLLLVISVSSGLSFQLAHEKGEIARKYSSFMELSTIVEATDNFCLCSFLVSSVEFQLEHEKKRESFFSLQKALVFRCSMLIIQWHSTSIFITEADPIFLTNNCLHTLFVGTITYCLSDLLNNAFMTIPYLL